jgi:predicted alpha/beta-fold hydrolase
MPDLSPFQPALGLGNPNVQTIVSSVGRKLFKPRWLDNFIARSEHRDIHVMGQHLTAQYSKTSQATAPVVIIIHGWLGSADSSYVLSSAQALYRAGFQVVRLTLRDHGGTAHLNEGLFHSAMTDEVVAAAQFIMQDFPDSQVGLMGFSMGGNFALRLAKQLPELTTLAICPAISPAHTVEQIGSSLIYQKYFMGKWRTLWEQKQQAFPGSYDFSALANHSSIQILTEIFIAEHTDFARIDDYYAAYDLRGDTLTGVNATILAAQDDPIIPPEHYLELPASLNIELTRKGGHTAYIKNWQLDSWVDDYAQAFFTERLRVNQ